MSPQKRNLLEAFRNAGEVPLTQDEAAHETVRPLSPEEESILESESRLKELTEEGGRPAWQRVAPSMPFWLPWLAAMGMVFVIGIAIGRGIGGGGDVEAAGDDAGSTRSPAPAAGIDPAPSKSPGVPRPSAAEPRGPSAPETSALLDPANVWTIVVITYSKTAPAAEDLAWATHDHLRDSGVPVFPPVEVGNKIVVLAGAAPTAGELSELEARIEGLSREGRSKIYQGAYTERIDTLIDRD